MEGGLERVSKQTLRGRGGEEHGQTEEVQVAHVPSSSSLILALSVVVIVVNLVDIKWVEMPVSESHDLVGLDELMHVSDSDNVGDLIEAVRTRYHVCVYISEIEDVVVKWFSHIEVVHADEHLV
jgi:hypothetical protein